MATFDHKRAHMVANLVSDPPVRGQPPFICKVKKLRLYFRPEIILFRLIQNLGCPKFSSWGGDVTFTRRTFCKKPEGSISFTFGVRPLPVGFPGPSIWLVAAYCTSVP